MQSSLPKDYHLNLARTTDSVVPCLPPLLTIKELAAKFFTQYTWQLCVVEQHYFDELLNYWSSSWKAPSSILKHQECSRELRYFPAMLLQILALATLVLPPDTPVYKRMSPAELQTACNYSDIGVELMDSLGNSGSALTAVQAKFLRTSLLTSVGRCDEAWHWLGSAIQ